MNDRYYYVFISDLVPKLLHEFHYCDMKSGYEQPAVHFLIYSFEHYFQLKTKYRLLKFQCDAIKIGHAGTDNTLYVFQEMIYFNALIRLPRSGTPDKIIMSYRRVVYSTINFHMFLLIL